MKRFSLLHAVIFLLFLNLSVSNNIYGGGFDNPVVGLKATGMGFAYAGISDDASAVYHNPAGLAFQDRGPLNVEIYGYFVLTDLHYEANSVKDQSDDIFIIPGFFASKTFEKWAFGFGGYVPYAGGGASYDNFQGSPYKLEAAAGWNAMTGAVSYKLSPNLSIGGGISLYIGEMTSKFFNPTLGGMVENNYKGYSGYGAHLGLFYKPLEELGIGLVFRSEVPIEMEGTVSSPAADTDSEVEFTLPYFLTLGLGYEPAWNITIGFSVSYQMWGDMDSLIYTTGNVKTNQPTYYMNSWFVCLGFEYVMNKNFTFRAGLNLRQRSTKTHGLPPTAGDVDMLGPRIGLAYNLTDSVELNCSVMQNFGMEEEYNAQKFNQNGIFVMVGCRVKY